MRQADKTSAALPTHVEGRAIRIMLYYYTSVRYKKNVIILKTNATDFLQFRMDSFSLYRTDVKRAFLQTSNKSINAKHVIY